MAMDDLTDEEVCKQACSPSARSSLSGSRRNWNWLAFGPLDRVPVSKTR